MNKIFFRCLCKLSIDKYKNIWYNKDTRLKDLNKQKKEVSL